ncbi:MAG: ISAzo13 family transposase [Planctomycetaceae bacterium]|nr:ISAzo13 family transposase [Planctomycetaceae bacterium]
MTALEELLEDATAGDPITGLKWTHRSLRSLSNALRRRGIKLAGNTIARLMRQRDFSLRTNRKRLAGTHDPQRERQFRSLTRMRRLYLARGLPVISVDTKKKEWVGNFKNPGRCWRRQARDVLDHDFPRWAVGRAIVSGIFDSASNDGYAVVGTSHETPKFAAAAIRRWWVVVGRRRYPKARRLLIQADGGGANGYRKWAWKVALQHLADDFDLILTVTHDPPGASKWNPIEHRMSSLISANWAGEPLVSYETVLKYLRTTRSETGFHCRACLDTKPYPKGLKVKPEEQARVRLRPRAVLPQWNYSIWPHKRSHNQATYF